MWWVCGRMAEALGESDMKNVVVVECSLDTCGTLFKPLVLPEMYTESDIKSIVFDWIKKELGIRIEVKPLSELQKWESDFL